MYDWIPFFKEITQKAIENKRNLKTLATSLLGEDHSLLQWPLDPFTFVYVIASRNSEKNFIELKTILELETSVPQDRIFPTPQGNSNRGFHHNAGFDPLSENEMWDFFERTISSPRESSMSDYFEKALKIGNVGITKLTQALFLINPEYFIPIDDRTAILFPNQSTKELKHTIETDGFSGYLKLMDQLKTRFKGCDFWEMNRLAYAISGQKMKLDFDNPWNQISSQRDGNGQGDFIDEWFQKSVVSIGYTEGESYQRFKNMSRGDIVIVKKGSSLFHGLAIIAKDSISSNSGERPVERDVFWILKDKSKDMNHFARKTLRQTQKNEVYDQIAEFYPKMWTFLAAFSNETQLESTPIIGERMNKNYPLNQILYGPPGTGKTYSTRKIALDIIEPENNWDEELQKEKFKELIEQKRISFVTFHQSFGYEEFVEGIRPEITDDSSGNISYEIRSGIFKEICERAKTKISTSEKLRDDWQSRGVWKMSLGDTHDPEESGFFDFCIENNCVFLGYGNSIDYSQCQTKEDVKNTYISGNSGNSNSAHISILNTIKNDMEVGDLILVSYGNRNLRGLAEITGDYKYSDENPMNNAQTRPVKWLWYRQEEDEYIFWEEVLNKKISQRGLYNIKPNIKTERIVNLFNNEEEPKKQNYVLIIDEINRGNVASIFGELITLIEADKRAGMEEELPVTLPYSQEPFSVPPNLYIIGTMNTADRSVEALDSALRRRFSFQEFMPNPELLYGDDFQALTFKDYDNGINLKEMLLKINNRIEKLKDRDHTIGHSYFYPLLEKKDSAELKGELINIFSNQIIPLLKEYFYGDWEKIGMILGCSFIEKVDNKVPFASGFKDNDDYDEASFAIRDTAKWDFVSIYE